MLPGFSYTTDNHKGFIKPMEEKQRYYEVPKERKPFSEMVCFKCNKKGYLARNCIERALHLQEECVRRSDFSEERLTDDQFRGYR